MSFVVDLRTPADGLIHRVQEFNKLHPSYAVDLKKADADNLVLSYLEQWIYTGSKWVKERRFDDELDKLVPWYNTMHISHEDRKKNMRVVSDFDEYVLDDLRKHIGLYMPQFFKRDPWMMWSIIRVGRDVRIGTEMDYRIFDWERRMKSGEWNDSNIGDVHS